MPDLLLDSSRTEPHTWDGMGSRAVCGDSVLLDGRRLPNTRGVVATRFERAYDEPRGKARSRNRRGDRRHDGRLGGRRSRLSRRARGEGSLPRRARDPLPQVFPQDVSAYVRLRDQRPQNPPESQNHGAHAGHGGGDLGRGRGFLRAHQGAAALRDRHTVLRRHDDQEARLRAPGHVQPWDRNDQGALLSASDGLPGPPRPRPGSAL